MSARINVDELKILADLVKLDPAPGLSGPEASQRLEALAGQCSEFMRGLAPLLEAEAGGIAPAYLPPAVLERPLPLRPDKADKKQTRAELLAASPEADEQYFVVPRMV